jgi:siderophore synthetase component
VKNPEQPPALAVAHLHTAAWRAANVQLVAKAISELAHELVLEPRELSAPRSDDGWAHYALATDRGDLEYRFRARVQSLEHWQLDARSLRKVRPGQGGADDAGSGGQGDAPITGESADEPAGEAIDAMAFVVELRERYALPEQVLPEYLHEVAASLYAACYKLAHAPRSAAELARADFQTIESELFLGHPVFVANRGRIGFDVADHAAYAPEAAAPLRLLWLAARREHTERACAADLSYEQLMREELGEVTLAGAARQLAAHGLALDEVTLLPVHPWQWRNRLVQLFAGELARGELIFLGDLTELGDEPTPAASIDEYRPQQSIRTFANVTSPHRRYVKTSLSILNMGFTRGIPSALVRTACATNDWVRALVQGDAYLQRLGFRVLREVAIATFRHRGYERASALRSDPYKEMLGAQWRESPVPALERGQRLMSMAALLHVDAAGVALVAELVRASGIGVDAWVRRYLDAYLKPQLHCFYAHRLVFTPHCENVILVLEDDVVRSTILKDLAEDVGVLNPRAPLPDAVKHLALTVPEELMTLSIFTDVFDGVFRFLAQLLAEQAGCSAERFWCLVADCVADYQRAHPEHEAEHRRFDLFAPTFLRNCLNRLQLTNNRLMVDLNAVNPVASLQFRGSLENPIARYGAPRGGRDAARAGDPS